MMLGVWLCVLLSSCLLFAATAARVWKTRSDGRDDHRRLLTVTAWSLLAAGVVGLGRQYGWELGVTWSLLWLGLGGFLATVWASVSPWSLVSAGAAFSLTALVLWAV